MRHKKEKAKGATLAFHPNRYRPGMGKDQQMLKAPQP